MTGVLLRLAESHVLGFTFDADLSQMGLLGKTRTIAKYESFIKSTLDRK